MESAVGIITLAAVIGIWWYYSDTMVESAEYLRDRSEKGFNNMRAKDMVNDEKQQQKNSKDIIKLVSNGKPSLTNKQMRQLLEANSKGSYKKSKKKKKKKTAQSDEDIIVS